MKKDKNDTELKKKKTISNMQEVFIFKGGNERF